ncbi:PASTA domain-containing protein [Bifidobacterium sp. CP2]|uniref:protein kinase domain-containing protein n=1 Tax=Bifidobacterium sp. CP2 TaxID=2809025 RepID=UPI001BDC21AA|nr:PASTA domain-containing protein [Bifidobacterium sp. CP2]MBT1182208.1 PASTA domain-containing protein [Bifidobacterium sp. CP2]
MSEAAQAPEGRMIEGRYRIVRQIAQGGMATVYEAHDERLERTVAVKVMHTQLAQGPHRDQFIERFKREARSAAQIANPHIVQVYDAGEFEGLAYLVMEYVHGVNLRQEMQRQGTFTVRETLRVVAETLDGLAAAHRVDVVHRDIKPENIMLNDRGHVQITDFGLAKATSQATLSSTGMLLGTAAYLPPETIERNEALPQGDLYAVGIMAWEMLAGTVPFISDNPVTLVFKHVHEDVPSLETVCPGIHPHVAQFIAHLTARAIDARPADATEALDELRRMSSTLPLDAWGYRLPTAGATGVNGAAPQTTPNGATEPPVTAPPAPPMPPAPRKTGSGAATSDIPPTTAMDQGATQVLDPMRDTAGTQVLPRTSAPGVAGADGDDFLADFAADGSPRTGGADAGPIPAHHAAPASDGRKATDGVTGGPAAKPRRTVNKAAVIAVVVTLVVALTAGGTGAWWYYLGPGSYWALPKPDDITCTQGKACTLDDAVWKRYESTLKVTGIPYKAVTDYSDTVAEGAIIAARVGGADATVDMHISKRHPSTLQVTVSKGVKTATIPADILDASSGNGKAPLDALKAAGFTNVKHDESKDEYSMTLPEGAALSISPDPGTTLKHNDEVTVTLSKGPMPVTMPDIVGRTKDDANGLLADLKLSANYSEEYSDTVDAGKVISASQKKGAQLHWGDTVDVVVSKGPEMVTIPDVRGQSYDDAAKALQALGLDVKKSAPLGDVTHTVRLQDPAPGQQVRIRDANGTKTVVTLTVV